MASRIDTRPRKRNAPRPAHKSAPGYLQWLRSRAKCAVPACDYLGRMEAAHVDYAGDKGMGTKVSDKFAVPMCPFHHSEQHDAGWDTFQHRHTMNALAMAFDYWRAWPNRPAWEAKNL